MIDSHSLPAVSVVMSVRDMAATVEATIRSVIHQTFTNWELIVIDDGSRDDGVARVAAFDDPRIRIIRHEQSKGIPCRLNEAIRLARGEFIARLDGDDICYPERLAVQVAMLQSDPAIDLLASEALVFRRRGEVIGFIPTTPSHKMTGVQPYGGFPFPHPTWCGRAVWFRAHPYDERLRRSEDQDLLLRTASFSRFASAGTILLGYRKENINLSKRFSGTFFSACSIWRHASRVGDRRLAINLILKRYLLLTKDIATVARGGREQLLKRRIPALTNPEELARWRAVWSSVSKI